jgi:uncharacterized membrane protein YphA (DoxX/SURF4 family)
MAIKINEPIGDSSMGPLWIRLTVGAYFLLAGLSKLQILAGFVAHVKAFGILSDNGAYLYGVTLPYLELFVGGCLLLGLWTTLSSIVGGLMIVSFIWAFGLFPGSSDIFNKDIVVFGALAGLAFTGPGAFSLDNLRRVPSDG